MDGGGLPCEQNFPASLPPPVCSSSGPTADVILKDSVFVFCMSFFCWSKLRISRGRSAAERCICDGDKINYSVCVHVNEGTCRSVQQCASVIYSGALAQRNKIHQAVDTHLKPVSLDQFIVGFFKTCVKYL